MEKAAKKCEKDANIQKAKVKKVHQCHAMHHSCVHVACSAVLVTLLVCLHWPTLVGVCDHTQLDLQVPNSGQRHQLDQEY